MRDRGSDAASSAPTEAKPAEQKNKQQDDEKDGEHEPEPAFRLVGLCVPERRDAQPVAARTENREELWVTTQGANDG